MNSKLSSSPPVSIVIVNTNELSDLRRCLPSIFKQNYAPYEVLVIDNCSTDGSVEYVEAQFPRVKVIRNGDNLGYSGANNVGFRMASGEYIVVLNPDTQVHPDWLTELVAAFQANPQAALATPKILMMKEPALINACGNEVSFTTLAFCRGLEEPAEMYSQQEVIAAVSGAAFMIKRSVLEQIGGFDDDFFLYYEDTDLSMRATLAGYTCIYVPTSVVYHDYAFGFSPRKCYLQERNRYVSLIKTFRWRTLAVLVPMLLLSELIAWGYSLLRGPEHVRGKLRSYVWLFQNHKLILEKRRQTQALRRVGDRVLLSRFSYRLGFRQATNNLIANILDKLSQPILFVSGRTIRAIVSW